MLAAEWSSPLSGPCEGGSSGLLRVGFIIFGGKAEHVTADKRLPKPRIAALIRSSKYGSPSTLGQGADIAGMWGVGGCVKCGISPWKGGLASGAERWPELLAVEGLCSDSSLLSGMLSLGSGSLSLLRKLKAE